MASNPLPGHKTVVALNVADARERLLKALDTKYVGELSGRPHESVRVDDVMIMVFYIAKDNNDFQHVLVPTAIHMSADILRELIGIAVEYKQKDLFKNVK